LEWQTSSSWYHKLKRLGIGVWGAGRIGSLHAANIHASAEKVELIAVADPIKRLATAIARRFECRAYHTPAKMLEDESLDGVVIATPTQIHTEHVELAAERRVPMLLEKPIALTMKEADRIVSIIARSRVKFQLGFNRRFDSGYRKAKMMITEGRIGKPILVKTCARDPQPPPDEYIRRSGGIFVDECIHDFDMALWLMNYKAAEVWATGTTLVYPQFARYGDFDNAVAILKFRNGGLGVIEGSRTSKYGYDLRTEVLGDQGEVRVDNVRNDSVELWKGQGGLKQPCPWFLERFAQAYRSEIEEFCDYLVKGGDSPVSAEDGRMALQVALAARESAKKKRVMIIRDQRKTA